MLHVIATIGPWMWVLTVLAFLIWYYEPFNKNLTKVYLRATRDGVLWSWTARVFYDPWGNPFTERFEFGPQPSFWSYELKSNGDTSDILYRTQWRHKSGPLVRFGDPAPANLFAEPNPQSQSPKEGKGR
jgi:hypothetical protein